MSRNLCGRFARLLILVLLLFGIVGSSLISPTVAGAKSFSYDRTPTSTTPTTNFADRAVAAKPLSSGVSRSGGRASVGVVATEGGTGAASKADRLNELFGRLDQLPPANSAHEALDQVNDTLNEVEDDLSGVPAAENPGLEPDGRMYPPQADRIVENPNGSITATTRGNVIEAGADGSITITNRATGEVVYSKPGA